jgi:hypothetical protein
MAGPLKDKRKRKYQEEFLKYGFTSVVISGEERPRYVICCEVLENESFKVNKLIRHLKSKHDSLADRETDFFKRTLSSGKTYVQFVRTEILPCCVADLDFKL